MSENSRAFSEAVDGFREMRSYLTSFQGFKFIYIRRNANFVAHMCVKEALKVVVLVISFLIHLVLFSPQNFTHLVCSSRCFKKVGILALCNVQKFCTVVFWICKDVTQQGLTMFR